MFLHMKPHPNWSKNVVNDTLSCFDWCPLLGFIHAVGAPAEPAMTSCPRFQAIPPTPPSGAARK